MLRKIAFLIAATAGLATAADVNFNGRWDLLLTSPNPDKAWWLEVSGAGTPAIKGRFIGFPGGDLNDIAGLKILVMPGDRVTVEVELITKVAMEKQLRFAIREGGRTVGAGVVASIIE